MTEEEEDIDLVLHTETGNNDRAGRGPQKLFRFKVCTKNYNCVQVQDQILDRTN